ncbi:hypothetical protein QTP88_022060 [Uroleucon formosanum]
MLSKKGKLIFIVNKFKFSFHKLLRNGQHRSAECTKRGCTANLKVLESEDIVWTSSNLEHKYDADEEKKIERQIISNNLKHPQSVGDCFSDELAEIQPINEKLTKFNDYLVENCIDNDSTFPPEIWATKSNSIYRTTDSCESFHSKFNSQFYSPHPNIFNFLNILYSIQSDTKIIIRSSNTTKPHRKEIRDKIHFLEDEIRKYDTSVHVHTRFQYMEILANKYRP